MVPRTDDHLNLQLAGGFELIALPKKKKNSIKPSYTTYTTRSGHLKVGDQLGNMVEDLAELATGGGDPTRRQKRVNIGLPLDTLPSNESNSHRGTSPSK